MHTLILEDRHGFKKEICWNDSPIYFRCQRYNHLSEYTPLDGSNYRSRHIHDLEFRLERTEKIGDRTASYYRQV